MKGSRTKSWFLRILLVVGVVLFSGLAWVGIEVVRGPVIPVEQHDVVEQPLFAADAIGASAGADAGATPSDTLGVELLLEEGEYHIGGGGPPDGVRIDAQYDSANYELSTKIEEREGRLPHYEVGFYRTTSALRSLMTSINHDTVMNKVEVALPEGVPIDLSLRLRRGQFEVDLTGLSIASLELRGGMGEIRLAFGAENPVEMRRLEVDTKMGDVRLFGLGFANARQIDVRGRMGEFELDFEGGLRADSEVRFEVSMGSGDLKTPTGMPFEVLDTSSLMGEITVRHSYPIQAGDPGAGPPARLLLDLRVRMGELIVH